MLADAQTPDPDVSQRVFNIGCLGFEGTPVQNDLQEFYAIIEFVNPGILGSSTAYRKVYEEPILRSRQPSCTEVGLRNICSLCHLSSEFSRLCPANRRSEFWERSERLSSPA